MMKFFEKVLEVFKNYLVFVADEEKTEDDVAAFVNASKDKLQEVKAEHEQVVYHEFNLGKSMQESRFKPFHDLLYSGIEFTKKELLRIAEGQCKNNNYANVRLLRDYARKVYNLDLKCCLTNDEREDLLAEFIDNVIASMDKATAVYKTVEDAEEAMNAFYHLYTTPAMTITEIK